MFVAVLQRYTHLEDFNIFRECLTQCLLMETREWVLLRTLIRELKEGVKARNPLLLYDDNTLG